MRPRNPLRIVIAGGGAIGWTLAFEAARVGFAVTLVDPGPPGTNASAIAAGMIAPAFEALFDPDAGVPLALMRRARDAWTPLAHAIGLTLRRDGALAVGPDADLEAWSRQLAGLEIPAWRLSADEARGRAPILREGWGGLLTEEDWRLEPQAALGALAAAAAAAGVARIAGAVAGWRPGSARLASGETLAADALVAASGASRSLVEAAPELGRLTPVKGHILTAPAVKLVGPVLRFAGGYVCPGAHGAVIGATMEAGRSDVRIDAGRVAALQALAARAAPALAVAHVEAKAGVRAASPDGRPLIGPSSNPGVWIAAGARRNGWLLAPLVARMLIGQLRGLGEIWAGDFSPARFGASGGDG